MYRTRVDYRWITGIRNRRNAILVGRVSKSRRLIGAHRSAIAKRVGESERGRKGGNMTVRRPEAAGSYHRLVVVFPRADCALDRLVQPCQCGETIKGHPICQGDGKCAIGCIRTMLVRHGKFPMSLQHSLSSQVHSIRESANFPRTKSPSLKSSRASQRNSD